jgi:hypothetical protein
MSKRVPFLAVAAVVLLSGCAPHAALELRATGLAEMALVESVFVDSAVLRRSGADGAVEEADLREQLDGRLSAGRRPSVAEHRDRADVLLVFEQSDRLACRECAQPLDRWHWWGFVFDREGDEIASWHDEVYQDRREPVMLFVKELRRLLRRARKAGR